MNANILVQKLRDHAELTAVISREQGITIVPEKTVSWAAAERIASLEADNLALSEALQEFLPD